MKQFFKFMLASIFGVIIAWVVLIFLTFAIIGGIVSSASNDEKQTIDANSVLELKLNYMISERTSKNPFEQFDFNTFEASSNSGLNDILKAIQEAEKNDNIKGIYLNISVSPNSYATLEAIRNALIEFKKSNKFVIAYGEMMEEHSYYLASVADEIYLNPAGELLIDGFSSNTAYLKGMFDKLGLEPQLIRHGKYKAAGEPLIGEKMSAENRQQIEAYLGSMYNNFTSAIAEARKKNTDEIKTMADELQLQSPEDAKRLGMITGVLFEDEVHEVLREKTGSEKFKDIHFINTGKLAKNAAGKSYSIKDKIAIVYCVGDIVSGAGDKNTMGSETIVKALREAKADSNIKAVVMRINSPGGSALASDIIWREVMLTKKVKPVIVSMGAVAASGGYYIAAPADVIVAEPNTVTGSIGVFALLMNANKLLKEKLGINVETVKFGKYADMGNASRALTPGEEAILQKYVDRIYMDFVNKVAEGRNLSSDQVEAIAQGRVWSGTDAKTIGLIDEFGGLDKAITIAAGKAGLTEYRTTSLPEQKEPFQQLLSSMSDETAAYFTRKQLGEQYEWYMKLKEAIRYEGLQMRMPMQIEIK